MEDCGEGGVRFRGAKKGTKAEMQFAERKIQTGCKEKKKNHNDGGKNMEWGP